MKVILEDKVSQIITNVLSENIFSKLTVKRIVKYRRGPGRKILADDVIFEKFYEVKDGILYFKTTLWERLYIVLKYYKNLEIIDNRKTFVLEDKIKSSKVGNIELFDYQYDAYKKSLTHRNGIFKLVTSAGKSYIIGFLAKNLMLNGKKVLIIGGGKDALPQMVEKMKELDVNVQEVSDIKKKNHKLGRCYIGLPIKTFNVLDRSELFNYFDAVIVDEVHHVPAKTYLKLLNCLKIKDNILYGFSATPISIWKEESTFSTLDYREAKILETIGDVICIIESDKVKNKTMSEFDHIRINNPGDVLGITTENNMHFLYNKIIESVYKTTLLLKLVEILYLYKQKPLILVYRKAYGINLSDHLKRKYNIDSVCDFGGEQHINGRLISKKNKKVLNIAEVAKYPVVIGSNAYDEAIDIPIFDVGIIARSGRSEIKFFQRIGRSLRINPKNDRKLIIDFNDYLSPILKFHGKLRREYINHLGATRSYLNRELDFLVYYLDRREKGLDV